MKDQPPLAADQLVATADERRTSAATLDWHHFIVVKKTAGVADAATSTGVDG